MSYMSFVVAAVLCTKIINPVICDSNETFIIFIPILAFCYKERASRELALSYGVYSYYKEELVEDERNYFTTLLQNLIEREIISLEDIICYLSGPVSGTFGTTFLEINRAKILLSEIENYTLPK